MKKQNIKKSKRFLKVTPAAFVLSTALLMAPGNSFAATDTSTKVQSQPVLMKSDGTQLPMTAAAAAENGASLPYIPTGPYEEFPIEWRSSTSTGALIDFVYVDVYAKSDNPQEGNTGTIDWYKGVKVHEGYDFMKIIKPDGTWLKPEEEYIPTYKKGQLLYTIAYPKNSKYYKDSWANATLKRDLTWKLIDTNVLDKRVGGHWSEAVTSGVSHNVTVGLAYTVGMEASFFGLATASSSLTASFGYGITLNSERTVTKTFDFNPQPEYAYDHFRTAVYQQTAKYSVNPSPTLKSLIDNNNSNNKAEEYRLKESVEYPTELLVALTSK
ncbi:hypothetical protein [Bacillus mycoides]|uniref:Peptidase n=1 Tax=Bacillus mycoides TaxID=1405 RepID=A0ABC9QUU8_BACMY|nr:hypothetical protein [Bacillus mycoides]EJR29947.1 hypothetical protein III_05716 [Bacillus mycoides]